MSDYLRLPATHGYASEAGVINSRLRTGQAAIRSCPTNPCHLVPCSLMDPLTPLTLAPTLLQHLRHKVTIKRLPASEFGSLGSETRGIWRPRQPIPCMTPRVQ